MRFGLAICGDPKRRNLAKALFDIYSSYSYLDEVNLYFRKNPAIAFNLAAREMQSEILIGVAGDVYIGEKELLSFISSPWKVICAQSPLSVRQRDIFTYPKPWTVRFDLRFISGLFKMPRHLLLSIPFMEKPSFCEDYLFNKILKDYGYPIASVQVPCVHIDQHKLFRLRTLNYLVLPERFIGMTLKQKIFEIVKMFGWEWQEIWAGIRNKSITNENVWEYEMSYVRN